MVNRTVARMRTRRSLIAAAIATTTAMSGLVAANAATPTNLPYGATWTVDTAANALYEYGPGASGADAPIATVSGPDTGLNAPSAVALDNQGRVFVTNAGNDSITEYAADATTDAAPLATISGANTLLDAPSSVTVNGGEIWVTDPDSNLVESFAVGSDGNEYPATTIGGAKTGLDHPVGIALGINFNSADGSEAETEVTVINAPAASAASITQYSSLRPGDVKPLSDITQIGKHALGSPDAIYTPDGFDFFITDGAANSEQVIAIFPGDARAESGPTITGLDDPTGVSIDAQDDIVVANAGDHSVRVFSPSSRGAATPITTLTGVGSGAGDPAAVVVLGTAPGAPQNVSVKMHKTSAHVSWTAPSFTGGGLVGYEVLAFRLDDSNSLLGLLGLGGGLRIRETTATSLTLNKLKPGHRYLFEVAAVNAFGGRAGRPVTAAYVLPASAPQHVKAFVRNRAALVSWKAPTHNGGANIKSYTVEYAAGCTPEAKGCKTQHSVVPAPKLGIIGLGGKTSGPSTTLKNLAPKTKYEIRVLARNKAGLGAPSRIRKVTTS